MTDRYYTTVQIQVQETGITVEPFNEIDLSHSDQDNIDLLLEKGFIKPIEDDLVVYEDGSFDKIKFAEFEE